MTVVFASNFFNHHQKPLSDAMYAKLGDGYHFIETTKITEERLKMGWGGDEKPVYVKQSYTSDQAKAETQVLIDDADVVILGSAPYALIRNRLKKGRLTFIYSERIYKEKCKLYKYPIRFWEFFKKYGRYKNVYLLCASAYTSADYAKTFTFLKKAYKWGYFPEVKTYANVEGLIQDKIPNSIVWVARFIDWKHPEIAVQIAKRLKSEGYSFELNMIGNGAMLNEISEMANRENVSDKLHVLGAMPPQKVREYMEKSQIFLFTSDRNEGWGAVLNEAMNSACAVVASHAIGAVPFMIRHGENGLIYKDGNLDDLYEKTKRLLENRALSSRLGQNANTTVSNEWDAETAAQRFVCLAEQLIDERKNIFPYENGICSRARTLKDNWM